MPSENVKIFVPSIKSDMFAFIDLARVISCFVVFRHRDFELNICAFVLPVSEFMATCIGLLFLVCQSVTDFQRKRSFLILLLAMLL